MKAAAVVTLLIVLISLVIYFLISDRKEIYPGHIEINHTEKAPEIYTMREIDSISAALNYRFTIKNAVIHLHKDSLKIPVKAEKPLI